MSRTGNIHSGNTHSGDTHTGDTHTGDKRIFLAINGKTVSVPEGSTVLQAIRAAGSDVPALCHHEAVPPSGACRLCMVEVTFQGGGTKLVTSCNHLVAHGMQVSTSSERIDTVRRTSFQLLLARNPQAAVVRELACTWGVFSTPYHQNDDQDLCIRCGRCVAICKQVGTEAISFVGRGAEMEVSPPFLRMPLDCIACASCASICPTGHIELTDKGHTRTIWTREFTLIPCKKCGAPTVSPEYRDFKMQQTGLPASYFDICARCKGADSAHTIAGIIQPPALAEDRADDQRLADQARGHAHGFTEHLPVRRA